MTERQGQKWEIEEEEKLYESIKSALSFEEIAQKHQRGVGGIKARCRKLGIVDDNNDIMNPLPDFVPSSMRTNKNVVAVRTSEPVKAPEKTDIDIDPHFSPDVLCAEGAIGVRLCNCLKNMGIEDVRQALHFTDRDFLRQDNFGRKTLREWKAFKERIDGHDVSLQSSPPNEEEPIFSEKQTKLLQRDIDLLKAIAAYDKSDAGQYASQIRNALFSLKQHVRSFEKILLDIHFDDEEKIQSDTEYEDNGVTAQKILELIEDIITFHIKNERAAQIARLRLGLAENNGTLTLQEIGDQIGVTRERVRQLETKAMRTLRASVQKRAPPYSSELYNACAQLFLGKEDEPIELILKFCKRFYISSVDQTKIAMLLGMSLKLFAKERAAKSIIYAKRRELDKQTWKETGKLLKDQKYLFQWGKIFSQGIYPENRTKFDGVISGMTGRQREINAESIGRTGSFYSEKCKREIAYESGEEHHLYLIMEKTERVAWYQEQPVGIPYLIEDREYRYFPDLAVVTNDGYGTIVEVKAAFNMVDILTLRKAAAATKWLHKKGMGYILTDSNGRSLKNLSTEPPSEHIEQKLLDYIDQNGKLNYETYKTLVDGKKLNQSAFISFIVHNDLAFRLRPFTISRLPEELSFKMLLG